MKVIITWNAASLSTGYGGWRDRIRWALSQGGGVIALQEVRWDESMLSEVKTWLARNFPGEVKYQISLLRTELFMLLSDKS